MKNLTNITRRRVLKSGLIVGAGLATPSIITHRAFGQEAKKVVFVSEESNPAAQAVYDKINKEFEAETGIAVTMEYPGFDKIASRVATLISAGTPPELVWYGASNGMQVALQGQLADVDDLVKELDIPENLRLVIDGHNKNVATSQQFVYGWYRSDLYEKDGIDPYSDWDSYLTAAGKLNGPPSVYGNLVPSAQNSASHLLMQTMMMKNDVHWFALNEATGEYEVALDNADNFNGAVEALEFLHTAHQSSPEASNYSWGDLMSQFFTGRVANSYYVGSRLLQQVQKNAPDIAPATKPIALPRRKTESYYVSVQGFHVGAKSNVDGAKSYIKYFMTHPDYISWLHSVPLHIIPAKRETLLSKAYQDNPEIQKRMDVLEFLDSVWGKGSPPYYFDGSKLNPHSSIVDNDALGGWMLAARNIAGGNSEEIVKEAANMVRTKMADAKARKG